MTITAMGKIMVFDRLQLMDVEMMRAFLGGRTLEIRNPQSLRPWQHVLDPVLAYLTLAEHLGEGGGAFAQAWNFGPAPESEITVKQIADLLHPASSATVRDCDKSRASPYAVRKMIAARIK